MERLKSVTILVGHQFNECVWEHLNQLDFHLHDTVVMVYQTLTDEHVKGPTTYQYKNLQEVSTSTFKGIWEECLHGSLNARSRLSIDEHMDSVEEELGPGYLHNCLLAYENGHPIGMIIPHIEPGTEAEGRIFYLGVLPEERGKGRSRVLHQDALSLLRDTYQAKTYIGSTSQNNIPMLKTLTNNGSKVVQMNHVYKWVNKEIVS
ncbi:hypothetical protein AB990_04565 [Alkalihalobacillus pseudalcaliphilus]|nr:hypothetical protein AB990_04565 [Alkalihalobacillus pseudalcaliphilus]